MSDQASNWEQSANLWNGLTSPLVPNENDLDTLRVYLAAEGVDNKPLKILLLGVTPQLAQFNWALGSELTAIDLSQAMIKQLWKPNKRIKSCVVNASWDKVPSPDDYFDLVLADCSFNALPSYSLYPNVANEIIRVMKPSATFITRSFVAHRKLSATELVAKAMRGEIPSRADLMFLLNFAFMSESGELCFPNALSMFNRVVTDRDALSAETGWPRETIDRADMVYSQKITLTFPTLTNFISLVSASLRAEETTFPDYYCGHHCPMVRFKAV